jgi:antibiotic biosynthesis monooxygenase (ABM) superfamily enzyme
MRYYTQLIFLKPGQADVFHRFEEHVLPLLEKYNGRMLLRWRRTQEGVIETAVGDPYEVHLVAFASVDDFTGYVNDDTRKSWLHLKDAAVERILLIEGVQI